MLACGDVPVTQPALETPLFELITNSLRRSGVFFGIGDEDVCHFYGWLLAEHRIRMLSARSTSTLIHSRIV
jgi:hypothetical protein